METEYYLLMKIMDKSYIAKARDVVEVLFLDAIHKIPGMKDYIEGIVIRNGILIPLINLEKEGKYGKGINKYAIIISIKERYIGLLCDGVDMVMGDRINIMSDNNMIKKYNYNEEFVELLLEINDKIYGLIEMEKLYRIFEENNIRRN